MSLLAPFQFIQQRGGKAAKRELVDTGRTARTRGQLDLTAWRESAKPPCVKAARRSQKLEREKKKVLCVGIHPLLLLCHTARMCIHRLLNALAVAPVPPRSLRSMETRRAPGSRARPLRGASWRIHPPEYRCLLALRAAFFICSLSFYFWIIFRKKKKKLGGGFLDRGGKISCPTVYNCFLLSAARQQIQNKSIYFFPPLKILVLFTDVELR